MCLGHFLWSQHKLLVQCNRKNLHMDAVRTCTEHLSIVCSMFKIKHSVQCTNLILMSYCVAANDGDDGDVNFQRRLKQKINK